MSLFWWLWTQQQWLHMHRYIPTHRIASTWLTICFITDINECSTDTHLCTQNCTNTNGSYTCDCKSGYQLHEDGFQCDGMSEKVPIVCLVSLNFLMYKDVDECVEGSHRCSQNCSNTDGSYECSCIDGYQLEDNGHSCNGIIIITVRPLIINFSIPNFCLCI